MLKNLIILSLIFYHNLYAISDNNNITNAIENAIREKLGITTSNIELKFDDQSILEKITSHDINDILLITVDDSRFRVIINYNDDAHEDEVSGNYMFFIEQYIASRNIPTGSTINYNNVKILKKRITENSTDNTSSNGNIIGTSAKHHITIGTLITINDIKYPIIMHPNDNVNILYLFKNLSLKTLGIALEYGGLNDKIQVKNKTTGKIVTGKILDNSNVQINLDD